jgi:hypothetical protein
MERVTKNISFTNQIKYAFVISPHGNGLDCHRTWEALCLGCIVIVKKSPIDTLYTDLPVLIIDNWSDFGGPKDEFLRNFNMFKGENNATFIESDCFKVDVSKLPKFNIYMYDGEHSKENHSRALTHFYDCLDDTFVFIVDDWNWRHVREGTLESFQHLKLNTLYSKEIRTTYNDRDVIFGSPEQRAWHNGIYVAILQKSSI